MSSKHSFYTHQAIRHVVCTGDRGPQAVPHFEPGDKQAFKDVVEQTKAKTVLEFGPGTSTEVWREIGLAVTTCEDLEEWFEPAVKRFKGDPQVRVLKYDNTFPVVVHGLKDDERFDLGFVDSPKGYDPARVRHKGYEDTSRLNTCLFALSRCKYVLLHDANRPLERGTLGRLSAMGFKITRIETSRLGMVIISGNENRPDLPRTKKPRRSAAGAKPQRGRVSIDVGHDRLDDSGTGKKGRSVRRGRRQLGKPLSAPAGAHSGVEGSA